MKKLALLAVLAFSQVGATDCGTVIRDPGFDLWCGDEPCSWKVIRGDIRRVGTWHKGDSGIELVGLDAAIQQLAPVTGLDGNCIEFTLLANVDANADLFLHIDVFGDGTIERSERIPTAAWKPLSFHIFLETPYNGIRFEIAKTGAGVAAVAQIGAVISDGCEGLSKIPVRERPLGAACDTNSDCASDICGTVDLRAATNGSLFRTVCLGCDPQGPACADGPAGEPMTCGATEALTPVLGVAIQCVPVGSREVAEQCLSDAECETGKCSTGSTNHVCAGCESSADCAGAFCGSAWVVGDDDIFTPDHIGPDVCAPGQGDSLPGTACGANADCASGACNGAVRKECEDGRACGSPADCPVKNDGSLAPGPCTTVGIQGGTCA